MLAPVNSPAGGGRIASFKRFSRSTKLGAAALVLVAATASALAYGASSDAASRCIAAQEELFLRGAYARVPGRAADAAELWCRQHDNQAGHPRFS